MVIVKKSTFDGLYVILERKPPNEKVSMCEFVEPLICLAFKSESSVHFRLKPIKKLPV